MCEAALTESDKRCVTEIQEVVKDCDAALRQLFEVTKQQAAYIDESKQYIDIQSAELGRRATTINKLEKEKNAWYRNPYIMIGLGLVAGSVGANAIGR